MESEEVRFQIAAVDWEQIRKTFVTDVCHMVPVFNETQLHHLLCGN